MKTNKSRRSPLRLVAGLAALAVCVGLQAAAPVITNIVMVPRLTIQSDLGSTNQIQYSTDLGQTNWTVLTNLVVTASPYSFVDVTAPPASFRFYRVIDLNPAPTNMVFIPAGSFVMGDTLNDHPGSNELPTHTVQVSAFYMDKYEVTKALWDEVYNWAITHGYSFEFGALGKTNNHPAHSMTWYDAVKWCNARSEKEGRTPAYFTSAAQTTVYRSAQVDVDNSWVKWNRGYRLPTEAEWEKAARGGASGHRFPLGDTIFHAQANYNGYPASSGGYAYDLAPLGYHPAYNDGVSPYTSPAGSFAANGYGLCDMAGNVFEWCWDWYGSYSSASQTDPRGPTSGGSVRVFRGGSWDGDAFGCRTAYRYNYYPAYGNNSSGFRSVLPSNQCASGGGQRSEGRLKSPARVQASLRDARSWRVSTVG